MLSKKKHPPGSSRSLAKEMKVGAIASGAGAIGTLALGTAVLGAFAVGAIAVGALAIGKLKIGRARLRRLEIDELYVEHPSEAPPRPCASEARGPRRWRSATAHTFAIFSSRSSTRPRRSGTL